MPGRLLPPLVLSVGPKWNCNALAKRARPVPPGRMHHHARRLVDHHQPLVLIEHVQGDVLRPRRRAGNLRQHDHDPLARLEPIRRLAAPAVHPDAAGRNHAAEMNPAVVGKMARQEGVQPVAGLGGLDRDLDRLGGKRHRGDLLAGFLVHFFRWRTLSADRPSGLFPFSSSLSLLFARVRLGLQQRQPCFRLAKFHIVSGFGHVGRRFAGQAVQIEMGGSPGPGEKAGFGSKWAN